MTLPSGLLEDTFDDTAANMAQKGFASSSHLQPSLGGVGNPVSESLVRSDWDSKAQLPGHLAMCRNDRRSLWVGVLVGFERLCQALAGHRGWLSWKDFWTHWLFAIGDHRCVAMELGLDDIDQRFDMVDTFWSDAVFGVQNQL
jgi:hypothetical protein